MNKKELKSLSDNTFFDNDTGDIQPREHRKFNTELIDTMVTELDLTTAVTSTKIFATKEANRVEVNAKNYADELSERIKYISLEFSFDISTNKWSVTLLDSNLENPGLLNISMAQSFGSAYGAIGALVYNDVNWYGPSIQASFGKCLEFTGDPWDSIVPFRIEVPYDGIDGPGNPRKLVVYNLLGKSESFKFSVNISCIFK